jgi:hypothetical protein
MAKKRSAAKRAAPRRTPLKPPNPVKPPKHEPQLPRATFTMVVSFDRVSTSDLSEGELRDLMTGVINLAKERGEVETALAEWAPTDMRTEVLS